MVGPAQDRQRANPLARDPAQPLDVLELVLFLGAQRKVVAAAPAKKPYVGLALPKQPGQSPMIR
jgi:hypothetical protein